MSFSLTDTGLPCSGVGSSLSLVVARSADFPRLSLPFALRNVSDAEPGQSVVSGAVFGGWSYDRLSFGLDFEWESLRIDFVRESGLRKGLFLFLTLVLSSLCCGNGCGRGSGICSIGGVLTTQLDISLLSMASRQSCAVLMLSVVDSCFFEVCPQSERKHMTALGITSPPAHWFQATRPEQEGSYVGLGREKRYDIT